MSSTHRSMFWDDFVLRIVTSEIPQVHVLRTFYTQNRDLLDPTGHVLRSFCTQNCNVFDSQGGTVVSPDTVSPGHCFAKSLFRQIQFRQIQFRHMTVSPNDSFAKKRVSPVFRQETQERRWRASATLNNKGVRSTTYPKTS